jgi:hypothetical protein
LVASKAWHKGYWVEKMYVQVQRSQDSAIAILMMTILHQQLIPETGTLQMPGVNAKMTNFVISPEGYVLSGEPFSRSFSEYWDISVNSSGKWYLVNIRSQIP